MKTITRTIIHTLIIPAIMMAAILGFIAGNEHGERYGIIAGKEHAEDAVLQLDTWTMRAMQPERVADIRRK